MDLNKAEKILKQFENVELNGSDEQIELTVELARAVGVREDRIFHNLEEFDTFMTSDKPLVLGRV